MIVIYKCQLCKNINAFVTSGRRVDDNKGKIEHNLNVRFEILYTLTLSRNI